MPAHVIVLHRWTDAYADYAAYLDHTALTVGYVTTARARAGLPDAAAGVEVVPSTEDRAAVRAAVARLAEKHGAPERIVALHEVDLDVAAELRAELGIPGETPEQLHPFRDKLAMARRLAEHGVPVPAAAAAPDRAAVAAFAGRHGWPLLLKPVRGTASSHVTRLDGPEQLAAFAFPPGVPLMVQPYLPHDILHVDGFAAGGDLRAWRASRYVNTCLDFTRGDALGSVEIDDPALLKTVGEFARRAVLAMSREPWVFHLELFADGDGSEPDLCVLEVGARPGGAEVPFVWREVHGTDLMAATVDVQIGYEHSGARFRFRGRTSAEVEAALTRTLERLDLRCASLDPALPPRVAVVGTGGRPYREYALRDAAAHGALATVNDTPAGWEQPYTGAHRTADTSDTGALTAAVADVLSGDGPAGLLTWSEALLERTAEAAARLGLPHMSPQAVRNCRDKLRTRRLLERAGLPSARHAVVHGLDQAREAADRIGYPVVLKPRGLAGSSGVALARTPADLAAAHRHAGTAAFPGLDALDGLIVEEYLDGPEVSLDSVAVGGAVHCVNLARKRLGYGGYFEEVGHLVSPWRHEPWAAELVDMVTKVHAVLGVTDGVTHAEVRLTDRGPRLVELNGRLGGDFIPLLGRLATGVDLTAAAMDAALGVLPDLRPTRDACAAVRFLYPEHDGTVEELDLSGALAVPGVERVVPLAEPGQQLLLPPRGVVQRLAAVIAVAEDTAATDRALAEAAERVHVRVGPARVG